MKEIIIADGAIAGALIAIITLALMVVRPIRKFIKGTQETLDLHTKRQLENYLELLRMKIFSDSLPLEERVDAGDKYKKAGGNGQAGLRHEENVTAYKKKMEREGRGI